MLKTYKLKEFSEMTGISPYTLRNWDKSGKLVAYRTLSNYKYYTDEHLKIVMAGRNVTLTNTNK